MVNKLLQHFWSLRKEFARYFVVGICAVLVDIGSLFVLKEYAHFSPTVAVIINQPIIVTALFFVNKHWSFQAGGLTHRQIVRFYTLSVLNYLFSVVWIYVLHDKFGVYYLYARTANVMLAVGWNFLLYKYWVYREEMPVAGTPSSNS